MVASLNGAVSGQNHGWPDWTVLTRTRPESLAGFRFSSVFAAAFLPKTGGQKKTHRQ